MNKLSSKIKIYISLGVWVLVCAALFGYFFGLLNDANEKQTKQMRNKQTDLAKLEAEQKGYTLGKEDLERVKKMTVQPSDLFSNDLNFVNELRVLEQLGKKYDVDLKVSGISGTIKSVAKLKLNNELYIVPATISIHGPLDKCLNFIENLEHVSFITKSTSLNMVGGTNGEVQISQSVNFYLKQ